MIYAITKTTQFNKLNKDHLSYLFSFCVETRVSTLRKSLDGTKCVIKTTEANAKLLQKFAEKAEIVFTTYDYNEILIEMEKPEWVDREEI